MAYLPKLNPTVGGGLGGLPERRATSGGASNSIQRSIIGQAVKGSLAYRNTTTGDTYSLDPYEGLTELRNDSQTGIGSSGGGNAIGMFADGGYVLVYPSAANSAYVTFRTYDADGNPVSSITTVEALAVSLKLVVAVNPVNDNFHIIYSATSSQIVKRAIYTKAGVLVGSITQLTTTGPSGNGRGQIAIDFWDDGYSAIGWCSATPLDSTNFIAAYDTSGNVLIGVNGFAANYTQARVAVKCLSSSSRTLAVTSSTSDTGTSGVPICEVWQVTSTTYVSQARFVIAQDPVTGASVRCAIGYNEVDRDIAAFYTANNNLHMAVVRQPSTDIMGSYGVSREFYLAEVSSDVFNAISIGGDRYLVVCGYYNLGALMMGICNGQGEWIASPKLVNDYEPSVTVGAVSLSYSTASGRLAIAYGMGTAVRVKIYNYRNQLTETVRLQDQYSIKLADVKPRLDVTNYGTYSINATQATDKFVVAWRDASKVNNWAIYSSGGTLLYGPYANYALGEPTYQVKALLLPNGNVVLITGTYPNTITFGIYSPSNVLIGSITNVSTTAYTFTAEVANNGNFAIVYYDNSYTGFKSAMYSSSGSVVGSVLSWAGTQTTNNNNITLLFNPVSNNFFHTSTNNANTYTYVTVFSNTNTQVIGWQVLVSQVTDMHTGTVNTDGTVTYIIQNSSGLLYFRKLTSTGGSSVNTTSMANSYINYGYHGFVTLPKSSTENLFIALQAGANLLYAKKYSITNGASITTTPNSIGIGTPWFEGQFAVKQIVSPSVTYPKVTSSTAQDVCVTQSLNGDQYIMPSWGEIYRLSSSIPLGDYVIDGVVNTEAINGTCEIIQNGMVTRSTRIPRRSPFIANGTNSKKIICVNNKAASSN